MKKKLIIVTAAVLVCLMLCLAGCGLLGNSTDELASSGNTSSTTTTYNDVSRKELEEALTKYREIAATLADRVTSLEEAVRDTISTAKQNIGAYAASYVDCVMNISCMESKYNIGCQGTGFIISSDGYVITNNHVVYYEETVYKSVAGGGFFGGYYRTETVTGVYSSISGVFDEASQYKDITYSLQCIYRDAAYDLALCKIVEAAPVGDGWKAIPFYEGEVVRGDEILLLGNAQGFGLSATSGLVSATGKTFSDYPKLTFIQTDAAINGGNSGGPAINIYGGLIGVVNSKFVSTNIENMGFAIELSKLKEFLAAAKMEKSVTVNYTTVSAPQTSSASAA